MKNLLKLLTPRPFDAHKGLFGHVLIVGGAPGMLGATILAAQAASYVGAGLVTVATHPSHAALVSCTHPHIMSFGVRNSEELQPLLGKASIVAIGPGLGKDEWAHTLFATVLASKLPLLIDADGLNLLAEQPLQRDNWILTPHPGEAARLLKLDSKTIQQDRVASVTLLQNNYGGVAVLKGAGSLIKGVDTECIKCAAGNPGMAIGGMGDLLSGVIAGLVAQHLTLFDAAALGAHLHAHAGDLLAQAQGQRGMLPQDLLPVLRRLVNSDNTI